MNLALFENLEQWTALRRHERESREALFYVAVTPSADFLAECSGEAYKVIEDFYDDAALMDQGITNFGRVEALCDRLDDLLGRPERVSARFCSFTLKVLLDALLHRSTAICAVLDTLHPRGVTAFRIPQPRSERFDLPEPSALLTSRLLPLFAAKRNCEIVWLDTIRSSDRSVGERIRSSVRETALGRALRRGRRSLRAARTRSDRPDGPVLFYAGALDDAEPVRAEWLRRKVGPVISIEQMLPIEGPEKTAREAFRAAWERIESDPQGREYFEHDGVDLFPLAAPMLRSMVVETLPEMAKLAASAGGYLKPKPAVTVVCGMQGLHRVLAEASARNGIPVVSQHHGGCLGAWNWPMIGTIDLDGADRYWCYGEGVAGYLNRTRLRGQARPEAVGSPALDVLFAKNRGRAGGKVPSSGRRVLMYVPAGLYGDRRYFSYHMYPDIWYWRFQRTVVKTVLDAGDVDLIVKLPPRGREPGQRNPLEEWVRQSGVRHCHVLCDKMFADLMDRADAFVMDSPGTALLQALTTMRPVLFYEDSRWFHFNPHAMNLLRKRAVVSETVEGFLDNIRGFVREPVWPEPSDVNDEFLLAYGLHRPDGRAVDRAVDFLVRLARGEGP